MELKEFANLIDGRQYDYRMFTKEELQTFNNALQDISQKIGSLSISY